jgi:hypothetical protein
MAERRRKRKLEGHKEGQEGKIQTKRKIRVENKG